MKSTKRTENKQGTEGAGAVAAKRSESRRLPRAGQGGGLRARGARRESGDSAMLNDGTVEQAERSVRVMAEARVEGPATMAEVGVKNPRIVLKRASEVGVDDVEWIRRRAYELYLARQGRSGGSAEEDWMQAERECRERVEVPEILFQ